ncbi:serine protease inhibitor 42Dd-like isoform X2 [Drosophila teissieri]|uniref:serine protease inhibitor 42Dd-like isoform X2 n=1 Tax=Drosophila teissieri TaxID=7243 RepID=UPI001CB9FF25|nr:serine protease inhibitor 42Dd-like isoform X2 [Drosophila teissieri]
MKYLCLLLLATSVSCRFTDDFYQLLATKNANKNLISSPLSVEIALSMAYMGARGRTAQEMRQVLKLPEDKKEVAAKYKDLLTALEGREKVAILSLANRIYVNNEFELVPEYNQIVKDSFKAEAEAISVADPNKAASIINKWVDNQTRGKIRDIVTPNDMTDLIMVILNAIYFKGQWAFKFNPKVTRKEDFRISDQKSVPVEMMSRFGSFKAGYIRELGVKAIELPYRNSSLYMVIYLPDRIDGLPELEKKIAGFSLNLNHTKVSLRLPKFKIEFSDDLNDQLKAMGIQDAFQNSAEFNDLMVKTGARVGKVIHKAFIEVNEEGAEAAGITEITMLLKNSRGPLDFNVDHPFAYVIRDEKTIYFQGHFVNPE